MTLPPTLPTARVVLAHLDASCAGRVLDFYQRNRDHLSPTHPALPFHFYTEGFWERRLLRNRTEWQDGQSCRWFLTNPDGDRVVGVLNLFNIVRGGLQTASVGYALDHDIQGQGVMREALTAALDHAFGPMTLHRVSADHLPSNVRSAGLLRRLGFDVEGYARAFLKMGDGRWHDHVRTALTAERWAALRLASPQGVGAPRVATTKG